MTRSIPVEPGSDTVVKKIEDNITFKELREWIEKYGSGGAKSIRIEIVKTCE